MPTTARSKNLLVTMLPIHRLLISLGLSGLVFLLTRNILLHPLVRAILHWDVFAFFYVSLCWIVVFKNVSYEEMRRKASLEDGSRLFVYTIIVLSSLASMLTVLLLITSNSAISTSQDVYVPVAVAGMLFAWIIVHTSFGFHYAHLYYDNDEEDPKQHAGGLDFPDEKRPDYLDFAYFSFVIGMTFQVSDVEISSRKIRRSALVHGLLSFVLNTFVVALTINLIAGLKK
jgi:uncharacterized membrane protein